MRYCTGGVLTPILLIVIGAEASCGRSHRRAGVEEYVGSSACETCHTPEYDGWARSAHARAMRRAVPEAVAAVFDGQPRAFPSLTVRPTRNRAGLLFEVQERGSREQAASLSLPYVMGHKRIEQYVTPTGHGRMQALPVAYDTGAREWFDLLEKPIPAGNWSHWMGPGMTANTQCFPCHATGYVKGYDPKADTYASQWNESGVGCEACHGPGAAHVACKKSDANACGSYGRVAADGMAACAGCHSRRVDIASAFSPEADVYDFFDPELLESDLYYPDGQVREEAYEWTSFKMSRMAQRGIVCQDCHEVHSAHLRAEGDNLCLRCHASTLATLTHTHHTPAAAGARCVGCHMPVTVFMQRDARHDHQLARPDPALALTLGIPDACTRCHSTESATWAAAWVDRWYGESAVRTERRDIAATFNEARFGNESAVSGLVRIVSSDMDAIRRATAARLLSSWVGKDGVVQALVAAARDEDALVRAGAIAALGEAAAEPLARASVVQAARDGTRLVRMEAAFALRSVDPTTLEPAEAASVAGAWDEWLRGQALLGELPDPNYNVGIFWAGRGKAAEAESAYRTAISRWPAYLPALQNLALLLAEFGRDAEAERELHKVLASVPDWPPATFALGLIYGRQNRWRDAAGALEACVRADPDYPRGFFNLGIAQANVGKLDEAADTLQRATADPAARADALRELVRLAHVRGNDQALAHWLPQALRADPVAGADPRVRAVLRELGEADGSTEAR